MYCSNYNLSIHLYTYTLELGTPAQDIAESDHPLERDRIQKILHRSKILVFL